MSREVGPRQAEAGDVSPARIEAAAALRRLGHAIVAHHADDETFRRITVAARELEAEVAASAPRRRDVDEMKRTLFSGDLLEGGRLQDFPDCIVSGEANPMGIGMVAHQVGEEAHARVILGPAFEGAPRRAHGGVVAAVFDDVMGFMLAIKALPAFTGEMTVRYLAPVPVGEEIEFRGRLDGQDGRKLFMSADAWCAGRRIAESSAVFIALPLERFARGARPGTGGGTT